MAPNEWEGEAEEEINIEDEERSEEVEPARVAPDPGQPTAKQLADHNVTHYPFRTWCKFCIMGRGRGSPHGPSSRNGNVAIIGVDYFFITRGGVKRRSELEHPDTDSGNAAVEISREAGEIIKCIVIRCSKSRTIFAHVVPCKGLDEDDYLANLVVTALSWLGYTSVILKADNERALQAVITRVIACAVANCKTLEQVAREEPAKYDSQSNGLT